MIEIAAQSTLVEGGVDAVVTFVVYLFFGAIVMPASTFIAGWMLYGLFVGLVGWLFWHGHISDVEGVVKDRPRLREVAVFAYGWTAVVGLGLLVLVTSGEVAWMAVPGYTVGAYLSGCAAFGHLDERARR